MRYDINELLLYKVAEKPVYISDSLVDAHKQKIAAFIEQNRKENVLISDTVIFKNNGEAILYFFIQPGKRK